ncbi:meprin A subunit alpha-like isoform X2 [Mya arenaria]|uniref:meprin A subunit alpha-like isoform X2 n=1 Tax=Mya arenaria TaxID=6604 RepID=UPI0022E17040|nr:meprin A subunit alpha-like isoform X2 [Mya arenaria]
MSTFVLLTAAVVVAAPGLLGLHVRNAVTDPNRLWPNGIVPYTFHIGIDAYRKVHLLAAMKEMVLSTYSNHKQCVYFVPRTTEVDYVEFQFAAEGVTPGSSIGRAGGKQVSTIQHDITQDSILMALMFLIGINPEVSRQDRDTFLDVAISNVVPAMLSNFRIEPNTDTFRQQFDYDTVVMYPPYFGAANKSLPTIRTKNSGFTIGQTVSMSIGDVNLVQHAYHCALDASHRIDILGNLVFECHFHTDMCQFVQDKEDNFDWTLQSGPSPTPGTGPMADHSSGAGSYALAEANDHHSQVARMKTPSYQAGTYCFVIWVYAYGPDVGTLRVIQTDSSGDKTIIAIQATPISQWYHTSKTIEATSQFYVNVEAFMGNEERGDLAVDDVYIYKGRCIDWY